MLATADTLDSAIRSFTMLRNHSPYRFGGKWYVAQTAEKEYTAYRTKRAAIKHTIGQVWLLDFTGE